MNKAKTAALVVAMIAVALVFVLPVAWAVISSLKPERDVISYPPRWIPAKVTLINYLRVLREFRFAMWLRNSLIVSSVVTVIVVVIDSLAGYALGRLHFRGRKLLFAVILSMLLIPLQVYVIPLFVLFSRLRLNDTFTALVLPLTATVTGVYLFKEYFESVPGELEEAARIDGCSDLAIYSRIIMPLSKPILASVAIINFVLSWNNFLWPLIITRSDATKTLPVGLSQFMGAGAGPAGASPEYGISLAGAVMALLPTLVLFLALQKFFVQGIMTTGIKG